MCSMKICAFMLELLANVYFMSLINLKIYRKIEKREIKRVDQWMIMRKKCLANANRLDNKKQYWAFVSFRLNKPP